MKKFNHRPRPMTQYHLVASLFLIEFIFCDLKPPNVYYLLLTGTLVNLLFILSFFEILCLGFIVISSYYSKSYLNLGLAKIS